MQESEIRKNIRTIRILKDISQEYMAEQLGVSQSSYGKLERGATNLTMNRLDKIAKIFEMQPFDIVNFQNPTPKAAMAHGVKFESEALLNWKSQRIPMQVTTDRPTRELVTALNEQITVLNNSVDDLRTIIKMQEEKNGTA